MYPGGVCAGQRAGLGPDRRPHVPRGGGHAASSSGRSPGRGRCVERRGRPVADTDQELTGHRVPWFQEWIHHGQDDAYWLATDHRATSSGCRPGVPSRRLVRLLPPRDARRPGRTAGCGKEVRMMVGPWAHGRGLYTRAGMRDAMAALDTALLGLARSGSGCSSPALAVGSTCPGGHHRPTDRLAPAPGRRLTRTRRVPWARPAGSATTPPIRLRRWRNRGRAGRRPRRQPGLEARPDVSPSPASAGRDSR